MKKLIGLIFFIILCFLAYPAIGRLAGEIILPERTTAPNATTNTNKIYNLNNVPTLVDENGRIYELGLNGGVSNTATFSGTSIMQTTDGSIPAWGHAPTGLAIEGIAEFDGLVYFDAGTVFADYLKFGAGFGGWLVYEVDDGLHLAPDNRDARANNNLILVSSDYYSSDYDHNPKSANPTFFLHSALNPDTDNAQWGSLARDSDAFVYDVGVPTSGTGVTGYHSFKVSGTTKVEIGESGITLFDTGTTFFLEATNGYGIWIGSDGKAYIKDATSSRVIP